MYILIVPSFQCDVFFLFLFVFLQHIDLERGVQREREGELKGYSALLLQSVVIIDGQNLDSRRRSSARRPRVNVFMSSSSAPVFVASDVVSVSSDNKQPTRR